MPLGKMCCSSPAGSPFWLRDSSGGVTGASSTPTFAVTLRGTVCAGKVVDKIAQAATNNKMAFRRLTTDFLQIGSVEARGIAFAARWLLVRLIGCC